MTTPMVAVERYYSWLEGELVKYGYERDRARRVIAKHRHDVEARLVEREEKPS